MLRNHLNLLCEPSIKIPAGQGQNFGAQFCSLLTGQNGYTDTIRGVIYVTKGKKLNAW